MISLRHKLWLGFGGLVVILLAVSIMTVAVLTRYSHALEDSFRDNYNSVVFCDAMKGALDRLNGWAQWQLWETADSHIDVAAEERTFEHNLNEQIENCTLPGELDGTLHVQRLWQDFEPHFRQFVAASADRPALYRGDLLPRIAVIKQVTQAVSDMNMANMVSLDRELKRTLLNVRNALLILSGAGALLAAIVVWAAGAAVLIPLRTLTRSAKQIEAGNLDQRLTVRSGDEFSELAEAFNSMASRLREFRRLDQDRIIRAQQTTQLAIDSLTDAVFVIGPDERIEISNRTARTHFNIQPDSTLQQIGLRWLTALYESVTSDNKLIESQGYKAAIQVFADGEERFLLPRAVPMMSEDNQRIGVAVILVDVTRLRRADEVKSGVISTASHELRTPLTGVRMSLSMLTGDRFGALTAKQHQLLTVAREDSDRLHRIIDNLLNISRIDAGRANFQFQPMAAPEIISLAVTPLHNAFTDKGVRLEVGPTNGAAEVMADPISITSALTNLLSNALKYTPAGGQVRVDTHAADGRVSFSVGDTGPGIPPEFRERIFERFFRISQASGPTGAGLGLAIAKDIVEAHGGRIEVTAVQDGTGSVFRFDLPERQPESETENR